MAIKRLYGESNDTFNKRNSMKGYTYQSQGAKDALRDQYVNRKEFQYDLGKDVLYQQGKEQYKALGKFAMQDTIGQASALTGGYANSHATSAGQQAYNQYMQKANDDIPEYYAMALNAYQQAGENLLSKYNLYANEDQDGYNRYVTERSYLDNLAQMENSDARAEQTFNENVRQYNQTFAENQRQYNAKMAYQRERDKVADAQWQKEYALSQAAAAASKAKAAAEAEKEADLYTYLSNNGDEYTFRNDRTGQTYTLKKGVNPYTGTTNKDIKNGVFSNGYQPDNVNGHKLSVAAKGSVEINGRSQNLWIDRKTGKYYYWDGSKNMYIQKSAMPK